MNLAGRRVALTRPAGRNDAWAAALRSMNAAVEYYPLLKIEWLAESAPAHAHSAHGLIFVSPTAVELAYPLLRAERLPHDDQLLAAVGKGTASALTARQLGPVYYPEQAGSEGLLKILPPVAGQNWLIVQGQGGRDVLPGALRDGGAAARLWEVYRRRFDVDHASRLLNNLDRLHAIVISSSEAMRGLHAQAAGAGGILALQSKLIVVLHPRIAETARSLGFSDVYTAADAESVPQQLGECLQRRL